MAILRGPLLQDQARPVLDQKCSTEMQDVQCAVGATVEFWRKVVNYQQGDNADR